MGAATARIDRGALGAAALLVGALLILALAVATTQAKLVAPLVLVAAPVIASYRALLRWERLLVAIVLVIFLIPIKRYTLPSALPFNLEPYRLLIALVAVGWVTSLLVDRRVRVRGSGLEAPIALFALAAVASVAVNGPHIQSSGVMPFVVKTLSFFVSFFVLFYVMVSVVQSRRQLELLVRTLVGAGAIVALAALVEFRTHDNLFNHLGQFIPGLEFHDPALTVGLDDTYLDRSGSVRVYASAAHPIELSAVMVMLIPLSLYLLRTTGRRRWMLSTLLLGLATFATLSRTGIVMLVVVAAVFLWLRPRETRRMWPALVPCLLVVYVALPNTLGSLYAAFFPTGGLVAQQAEVVTDNHAGADGRITDIGPALAEFRKKPVIGQGFGSRITDRTASASLGVPRARLLDDQWLSSLLEVGLVGVVGFGWILVRSIRRLRRLARERDDDVGWLAVALIAAIFSFAVGMLTFDALGFVQVTLLLFMVLALGAVLVRVAGEPREPSARREAPQ